MKRIIPYKELKKELLQVAKPARYTGGELGSQVFNRDEPLKIAISFPDMYEIGMSNQAVRILYNRFNQIPGVQCERVFAPFKDFEEILRQKNLPLFSLESGIPLKEFDILAFSIGYELTLTNMLTIMDTGQIPIRRTDRTAADPIVVAGGPAATNPEAFSDFVDLVYIGEGEPHSANFGPRLVDARRKGATREELIGILREDPAYWYPGKKEKTIRSIYSEFGQAPEVNSNLPLASLTTVQDHGVIEIMRGCPNGCRFCHAGYFYRPFRQKDVSLILQEAEHLVSNCGFRNITLSSLSSGDYRGLLPLVEHLNGLYRHRNISFQLPSLRVNSLNLELLSEISAVRKSGLTFAVETPDAAGQAGINKDVSRDRIIALLREAKSKGWKLAKFYFMVGLPVGEGRSEGNDIADFLEEVQKETGVRINVNVGVFIPKPHTPYERARQFTDAEGMKEIGIIRERLRNKNFKVGFHAPFSSFVEGIISRGDARAGALVEQAYHEGARFDAWDEYHDRSIWKKVIEGASWDVEDEICRPRTETEPLPWDSISLRVTDSYMNRECEKSRESERTQACTEDCKDLCGVCSKKYKVRYPEPHEFPVLDKMENREKTDEEILMPDSAVKAVFSFSKKDRAIYLGHLDTMHVFERALQCSALPLQFSRGFNPKPKLEFAHPLSLGIIGEGEILGVELMKKPELTEEEILERINRSLPSGLEVRQVRIYPLQTDKHKKKKTLMGIYAGSEYRLTIGPEESLQPGDLLETLKAAAIRLEVADDYEFSSRGDNILVKALFRNKKMNNILKFMKEILPEEPLQIMDVTRTGLLAAPGKGVLTSYLDLDSSQS